MTRESKLTKGRIAFEFVSPHGIPDGDEIHVQHTGAIVLNPGRGSPSPVGGLWSIIGGEEAELIAIEVLRARGRWPE
jgi:hypothetical protein